MKTTIEWLDAAKQHCGLSDYALAPRLGLSRQQISRYRNGHDYLSEPAAVKLAELLGIDPLPILASAAAERTKSDDVRAVWTRYAEGLATFTGALVLGTVLSAPAPAHARGALDPSSHNGSGLYIGESKRQRKRTRAEQNTSSKPGWIPGFFTPGLFPAFP